MERIDYQVGDVVNDHVWTGTAWVPVNRVETTEEAPGTPGIGAVANGHRWDGAQWVSLAPAGPSHEEVAWYRKPAGIVGISVAGVFVLLVALAAMVPSETAPTADSQPPAVAVPEQSDGDSGDPAADQPPAPDPAAAPEGTVQVDAWTVSVAEINANASALIEDANSFNDDPDYGYIIVTLEGTNGAATIKDLQSFNVKFQGSDKVIYRDESWLMVMPVELATEAAPGGTVQAQFVFDLPASALGDGAVVLVDGVPVALK